MLIFTKLSLIYVHKNALSVFERKCFYVCRVGLEEELDMLRVQAAMDRATVKELNLCLAKEHSGKPFNFFFNISLFTSNYFSPVRKLIYLILNIF